MRVTMMEVAEWLAAPVGDVSAASEPTMLDEEDRARMVGSYRGLPTDRTGRLRYRRRLSDGAHAAHVLDLVSGVVYLVV